MNWISFEGKKVLLDELDSYHSQSELEDEIIHFIKTWYSSQSTFQFHTSGSTGKPKAIDLTRSQMVASAKSTIKALGLKTGSTALLCMNNKFIGGRMMIVRALINNMNLVIQEPSGNPLKKLDDMVDFAAMVPLQVYNSLQDEHSFEKLDGINTLIIGGAPLDRSIFNQLNRLSTKVYATYGMTETVSHIALKKLNSQSDDDLFTTLGDIKITTDHRNCLVINGAVTDYKDVITNDVVILENSEQFKWLGRVDNTINTGGIKIQIETLESKIRESLNMNNVYNRIFIVGSENKKLGQQIELYIESMNSISNIESILSKALTKYELPKKITYLQKFEETASGKVDKQKSIL